MLSMDHWLADIKNVMVLFLSETAWEIADVAVASTAPMSEGSIGSVPSWLEGLDITEPAPMLPAQSLNGVDLLSFQSASALEHDRDTTPFVGN